jgi:methionyl-tRNA formyltransferase
MRVVFLGTAAIGIPSLQALARDSAHEVQAVFTQPDRPAGRNLKVRPPPLKVAAQELGLPVFQPERIRAPEAFAELGRLKPDVIVVAAYGQIVPKTILSLPRYGCINVHASLLPRHRGAAPIHAAILHGDSETGITIMQMDEGLDTGDILLQVATAIQPGETTGSLHDRLAQLAPSALLECLEQLARGAITPRSQEDARATYAPKLASTAGELVWENTAAEIDRRIRAMTPCPGAYTFLPLRSGTVLLKVHRAEIRDVHGEPPGTVVTADDGGILVAALEGGIALKQIQIAGGKRLSPAEFLRGHPITTGTRLGKTE